MCLVEDNRHKRHGMNTRGIGMRMHMLSGVRVGAFRLGEEMCCGANATHARGRARRMVGGWQFCLLVALRMQVR